MLSAYQNVYIRNRESQEMDVRAHPYQNSYDCKH